MGPGKFSSGSYTLRPGSDSGDASNQPEDWSEVDMQDAGSPFPPETMQDRIIRVTADEEALAKFFNIWLSSDRDVALRKLYLDELGLLEGLPFDRYDQEAKVDYLLLKGYLSRALRRLDLEKSRALEVLPLLPFSGSIISVCESRQKVATKQLQPKTIAQELSDSAKQTVAIKEWVEKGYIEVSKIAAYRAVGAVKLLKQRLSEFHGFFKGYDPLFDWWVAEPHERLQQVMSDLIPVIETSLAGMRPGDKDEIVGDPIGRDALLAELEAELIPYTPEQLIVLAQRKYAWCEREMEAASKELGFGTAWKDALEHVKNLYHDPGDQPAFIKQLVNQGAAYVKGRNLVTVPPLAERTWRMFMMSPADQKVNPFFLGGPSIIVSFPTAGMEHDAKLMSMRGNNVHFSKATAFHEMIPGHNLQLHMADRHKPYRQLFMTPFYVEGWAMYWELVLWNNGDFFTSPEDRIGTLFWRMHRCARILFSLKFHLGQLSPQECVELLVDMVGHERSTAEGEVRRSLNGDYSALYQAGYYLGALQLWALRGEVLEQGVFPEKEFHDRILRANMMPIELLRALLLNKPLERNYKAGWQFSGKIDIPSVFNIGGKWKRDP